jgi:hypothetical protein
MHADQINHARFFRLTKVKDRFSSKACIGYRDICLNLEVPHVFVCVWKGWGWMGRWLNGCFVCV